jgi:hypothetical protein
MSIEHPALLDIAISLALESVGDMDIIVALVVVVVGEKLIFVAATSAQATLSSARYSAFGVSCSTLGRSQSCS